MADAADAGLSGEGGASTASSGRAWADEAPGLFEAALDGWRVTQAEDLPERRRHYDSWLDQHLLGQGCPAHEAAGMNDVQALHGLLAGGDAAVDVDQRGAQQETALHHAACMGALDGAALLLASGWDPSARAARGFTPLDYSCTRHRADHVGNDPRRGEQWNCNRLTMVLLLILYGAQLGRSAPAGLPAAVAALLLAKDEVLSAARPSHSRERRSAAALRQWPALCQAVLAVGDGALGDVLGPACLLLRLVLEVCTLWALCPTESSRKRGSWEPDLAGCYRCEGLYHGRPCYRRTDGGVCARWRAGSWELVAGFWPPPGALPTELVELDADDGEVILTSAEGDFPFAASEWPGLMVEAAFEPVATYSSSSFLPPVVTAASPNGECTAPFIGLLNPRSGSKMGSVILEEAARFPSWHAHLFDIVHVATRPAVMTAFRNELLATAAEARQRDPPCRPRLLCGGGDGTASFAIWCIFRALQVADNDYLWTDEELGALFPALVQMPLGTGNDLSGVLGWGRTINPVDDQARTKEWFRNALSLRRPVRNFDVWGINPLPDCMLEHAKYCCLAGLDPEFPDRPVFKEAGPAIPLISLLYFSVGFEAFVAALVELNRKESRLQNFLQYGIQISAGMLGAQRRNVDLSGVKVTVPDGSSMRQFFPPPEREQDQGFEYQSLGLMNINSFGGGMWSADDPALYDDGRVDLFRQRDFFGNFMARGLRHQTRKHTRAFFQVPKEVPGIHCQVDGEARFVFHPGGKDFTLDVRRVMQIPVVVGPDGDRAVGSSAGWVVVMDHDAGKKDAAFIPAASVEECKQLCIRHGFGGFCVHNGKAYFRAEAASELKKHLFFKRDATFYIRDERVNEAAFSFVGGEEKVREFRKQLRRWVTGGLAAEFNASPEELKDLQRRTAAWAQGVCQRSRRIAIDLGSSVTSNICSSCGSWCKNRGCKGCHRTFCGNCLDRHVRSAPAAWWMYADTGVTVGAISAKLNPVRWSSKFCLDDIITDIKTTSEPGRPITISISAKGGEDTEKTLSSGQEACEWLRSFRELDAARPSPPSSPVASPRSRQSTREEACEWLRSFRELDAARPSLPSSPVASPRSRQSTHEEPHSNQTEL